VRLDHATDPGGRGRGRDAGWPLTVRDGVS